MRFTYPLNYTERLGRCIIKKVRDYGYKYRVSFGTSFRQFAAIGQAREFAREDYRTHATSN